MTYRTLEEEIIELWRKRGMEVERIEVRPGERSTTWKIVASPMEAGEVEILRTSDPPDPEEVENRLRERGYDPGKPCPICGESLLNGRKVCIYRGVPEHVECHKVHKHMDIRRYVG